MLELCIAVEFVGTSDHMLYRRRVFGPGAQKMLYCRRVWGPGALKRCTVVESGSYLGSKGPLMRQLVCIVQQILVQRPCSRDVQLVFC